MNNAHLIAVYENGLHPQAKLLYGILTAYADASGLAVVEESHVAGIMHISLARLRGYRSDLNKSGYCSVAMSQGKLIFSIHSDHLARESDHGAITPHVADQSPVIKSDHLARESDHGADRTPPPAVASDHLARESDRGARESDHLARAGGDNRGGMNERVLSSPLPDDEFFQSFVPEAEQKMSIAILTDPDIRLGAWKARLIAQRYPFATVRAYCTDFVAQGKRPQTDAGLIDWWLKNEPVPPVVVGELYRRHRTPAEIAAEVEEQRLAEEQRIRWEAEDAAKAAQAANEPAPQPQPAPAPTEPQPQPVDVWAQVLTRLAATLPAATFDQWVKATSLLGVEDGLYTVGTPDALGREWLHNRLNQPVQRALSGVVGRSVTVQFVVKPTRGETDVREN